MARRPNSQLEHNLGPLVPNGFSRVDAVYGTLKEAILSQTLAGGIPLVESQIAAQFEISKTPVREALLRLAQEGLVDFQPIRGATVHSLTVGEIRDLFEMRLHLEPLALAQSAPLLSKTDLKHLEDLLTQAKNQTDLAELSRINLEFHRGLYQAAPNQLLLGWLESLNDRRRLLSLQGWRKQNRSAQEWKEHSGILSAIQKADFELAQQRLREHIQRFASLVLEYNQNPRER